MSRKTKDPDVSEIFAKIKARFEGWAKFLVDLETLAEELGIDTTVKKKRKGPYPSVAKKQQNRGTSAKVLGIITAHKSPMSFQDIEAYFTTADRKKYRDLRVAISNACYNLKTAKKLRKNSKGTWEAVV